MDVNGAPARNEADGSGRAGRETTEQSGEDAKTLIAAFEGSDMWTSLVGHPWIVSLIDGRLTEQRFRFWQAHNLYYLAEPISLAALPRIPPRHPLRGLIARYLAEEHESPLRSGLVAEFGADCQEWWWAGPAREAFTNFLTWISHEGTFPEFCCANYPCFAFPEIIAGRYHASGGAQLPAEQRAWVEELRDPLLIEMFNELRKTIVSLAEEAAPAVLANMLHVLVRATAHQIRTFDAAWHLEDRFLPSRPLTESDR
jgi:thiaminase